MSENANAAVAPSCSWCGRGNSEGYAACAGCGTPLVNDTPVSSEPKKKSKLFGVLLALTLGPLGLFYASFSGAMTMLIIASPFILTRTGGWWLPLGSRIACACWALHALRGEELEASPTGNSELLLNEAARLESIDRAQAVTAYEEIISRFPNTQASREAKQNIQTLRRPA